MIRRLESLCLVAAGTFVILACSGPGFAQIPAGPGLRTTLTTEQQTYFVGEDVPVRYCLENISSTSFEAWVGGAWRFKPVVFDANGKAMPQFSLASPDELSGPQRIDPGTRWCSNYQLLKFARIDQAGTYTVRAALEFVRPTILGPEVADPEVTADLVPSGWSFSRTGKPDWPTR